nr:wall-associated receptor kinase-like 20 [Coffea arabica]
MRHQTKGSNPIFIHNQYLSFNGDLFSPSPPLPPPGHLHLASGNILQAYTLRSALPGLRRHAVPYPLSIRPTCGDQLYKLRCSAGSLLFDTLNNTYPVTSVSPQLQRLTIQPSPSLPFNITNSNTILYLNCTQTLLISPLNCTSSSLCHTFINGTRSVSDGGACENSEICCTFRRGGSATSYSIRVRDAGCRAYRAFVNLDYSLPVSRWPQPGLELQWVSPSEPICRKQMDCDSESTCGLDPNSNSGVWRCFCNSGLHWDAIAGSCSKGKKDFLEAAETQVQWTLRVW